jgi:hypothetical protein
MMNMSVVTRVFDQAARLPWWGLISSIAFFDFILAQYKS